MLGAARGQAEEYTERSKGAGLVLGTYAPTTFRRQECDLRCVAHGDDFTVAGTSDWKAGQMEGWHETKMKGALGLEEGARERS